MRRSAAVGLAIVLVAMVPGGARATQRHQAAVDPGLLQLIEPAVVVVHFRDRIPAGIARARNAQPLQRFNRARAIAFRATPQGVRDFAARADVSFVEADHPIAFDLDSATTGSRAKWVWEPPAGMDPIVVGGRVVDGSGIGIAVVDSGVDGSHPDFRAPGKLGGNWIVTQQGLIEAENAGPHDPHGTHVAGIAAGNGLASGGEYRGAAPGATLYGFGTNTHSLVTASVAFQWILDNGDALLPPIRVLNNSWHCASDACRAMNPDRLHMKLATQLAEKGIAITWAAGNRSGDGITSRVSPEALNPTPGVISVANYNDDERGARNKCIVGSSSRGAASDPTTWPDLAAPGWEISSTWATGVNINAPDSQPEPRLPALAAFAGQNNYRRMSGTSMAAPHVAGIVALIRQARPDLTPRDIEYLLKATATKLPETCKVGNGTDVPVPYARADASHPYDGASFVDGHGLVDARAAVEAALAFTEIPPPPEPEPLPEIFYTLRKAVKVEDRLYLRNPGSLTPAPPADIVPPAVVPSEQPATYVTTPFSTPRTVGGVTLEAFIGTSKEHIFYRALSIATLEVVVDRITPSGPVELARGQRRLQFTYAGYPFFREWIFPFDEDAHLDPGDRIAVSIILQELSPPVPAAMTIYADAMNPSSVGIGSRLDRIAPSSTEDCMLRPECVDIGGVRQHAEFWCPEAPTGAPEEVRYAVEWFGPPGSTAMLNCTGYIMAVCTVPGEADDPWGRCYAESIGWPEFSGSQTECLYLTRDGARAEGRGQCRALVLVDNEP